MTTASSTVFQDVFTTNTEPEPPQRNRKAEITAAPEPDKGSLGSAAECSAAVNNGRDSDSSDEDEVDPILKKEFYRQLHESNGFDVDRVIPNNSLSMTICDNKPGLYHDMIVVYARGSNLQLSRVDKFISIMCGIFEYSITLEAKDPANSSCLTFQTRVLRAGCINGEHLRIQTVGCRIKPQTQGTGDKIHRWEYNDGIGEVYKDNLPKWISDDALVPSSDQHHQFYQVKNSDIGENDWLNMYAEIAMYSLREGDMTLLESWLPLEMKKVVVQTYDEDVKSKEKLRAGNANFYISFRNLSAPPNGLLQDHRAIVRRTTDGVPGHVSLEFKCWLHE